MGEISGFAEMADDLEEFADSLDEAADSCDDELESLLGDLASATEADAVENAPDGEKYGKRRGTEQKLNEAFNTRRDKDSEDPKFIVENTAGHAVPQEFGSTDTAPHTIEPNSEPELEFFWEKRGVWVQTKMVQSHPGVKAQWFLRDAVRSREDELEEELRRRGRRILKRATTG